MNTASELRFGPSRGKAIFLLVLALVFGPLGVLMASEKPLQGGLLLAFAVAILATSIALMLPSLTYLKLDAEGFELGSMGRKQRTRWIDIRDLRLVEVKANRMIGFDYTEAYGRNATGRALSSMVAGVEGALPCHFAVDDEELLRIMGEWHARHAPAAAFTLPPS